MSSDKKTLALPQGREAFSRGTTLFSPTSRDAGLRGYGAREISEPDTPAAITGAASPNWATRLILLERSSFRQRLGGHFRRESRRRISARAALCGWLPRVLVLVLAFAMFSCATLSPVCDNKIAPAVAGASNLPLPLSRRSALPELAPGHTSCMAGCRASSGRLPPPLWIRARTIQLRCTLPCHLAAVNCFVVLYFLRCR